MINRIKELFAAAPGGSGSAKQGELSLAAAALLVEAASMDGIFDAVEHAAIARLLTERFAMSPDEVDTLIAEAVEAINETGQLYGFTRVIKDRYDAAERILMIEMLWEVAIADRQVDHFESNLIRRVGGLLFVSDRDRGLAKQRVMARLA